MGPRPGKMMKIRGSEGNESVPGGTRREARDVQLPVWQEQGVSCRVWEESLGR